MNIREADALARRLMHEHNLADWRLIWTNAKARFGSCSNATKTIRLSRPLVEMNEEHHVKDTILHEIAHALTPGHHHDRVWARMAQQVGAKPERCYSANTVKTPEGKYVAVCPTCKTEIKRHRRPPVGDLFCGRCYRKVVRYAQWHERASAKEQVRLIFRERSR